MTENKKKVSSFAKRFSQIVEETGALPKELAVAIGVSMKTVYAWKSGERKPKPPTVAQIAQIFGVTHEWLEGYAVEKYRPGALDLVPARTSEARLISHGVDAMPQEERERALSMFKLMFAQYADLFDAEDRENEDKTKENDANDKA